MIYVLYQIMDLVLSSPQWVLNIKEPFTYVTEIIVQVCFSFGDMFLVKGKIHQRTIVDLMTQFVSHH